MTSLALFSIEFQVWSIVVPFWPDHYWSFLNDHEFSKYLALIYTDIDIMGLIY